MHPEILVPYSSFRKSIACYTDAQLLRTLNSVFAVRSQIPLTNPRNIRWNAREQWLMWHNWNQAFIHFGLMCVDETKGRGLKYHKEYAKSLRKTKKDGRWHKPYWIGWSRFHTEHQALLVHYGECERFAIRLIQRENEKTDDETLVVREWLEVNGFPELFRMDHYTLRQANQILDDRGVPPLDRDDYPNPYPWPQAMDRRSIELPEPREQIGETWLSDSAPTCGAYPTQAAVACGPPERPIEAGSALNST